MSKRLRIDLIGMVSRHHLIAWSAIADRAEVVAIAAPSRANASRRGDAGAVIQTLRLVEDCYRLSGWEAA